MLRTKVVPRYIRPLLTLSAEGFFMQFYKKEKEHEERTCKNL